MCWGPGGRFGVRRVQGFGPRHWLTLLGGPINISALPSPPRPLLPPPPRPSPLPVWAFHPHECLAIVMLRCRPAGTHGSGGAAPGPHSYTCEALQRMFGTQHGWHDMAWPPWAGPKQGAALEHHTPATLRRSMARQDAGTPRVRTRALLGHACRSQSCAHHVHGTHGVLACRHACTSVSLGARPAPAALHPSCKSAGCTGGAVTCRGLGHGCRRHSHVM